MLSIKGILSATNSIRYKASPTPITHQLVNAVSPPGNWRFAKRLSRPRVATEAYRFMPDTQAVPIARASVLNILISALVYHFGSRQFDTRRLNVSHQRGRAEHSEEA